MDLRVHLFDHVPLSASVAMPHAQDESGLFRLLVPVHWHGAAIHPASGRARGRAPHVPLAPGFLAELLSHDLKHLEVLSLERSGRILGVEDMKAVGGLQRLRHLELINQVSLQLRCSLNAVPH